MIGKELVTAPAKDIGDHDPKDGKTTDNIQDLKVCFLSYWYDLLRHSRPALV